MSARERIAQAVERWFLTEPLLFSVWTTHNLVAEPNIRTIRSGRGRIEYNPDFINALDRRRLDMVLRCEALRIVLKHPYTRRKENRETAYLASNITLQEYLQTELPLPRARDIFGDSSFDRQYFEFYYYKLQESADQAMTGISLPSEGQGNSSDSGMSSAGMSSDGESGDNSERTEAGGDAPDRLPAVYADASLCGKENTQDWDRDEFLHDRINEKIRIAHESNRWGTIAGYLQEQIIAALRPKLDYRAVLSHFRTSVLSVSRVLTRMKPSRRYGFLYMGSRRDFITRLLFAVDVSGSVSSNDLKIGFSVINRFFKYGIRSVDVIQFDTEIKSSPVSLRRASRRVKVMGRGGTDFAPVINYIDEHREYDGLIIFTDGCAQVPPVPQNKKTRVLWLFNSESNYQMMYKALCPIGRSAFLKED